MNEKDQLWVEWLLGVFGTTGLFVALALIGMAVQSTKMGWLSFVLGAFALAKVSSALHPFIIAVLK